jgi:hypothetical protein
LFLDLLSRHHLTPDTVDARTSVFMHATAAQLMVDTPHAATASPAETSKVVSHDPTVNPNPFLNADYNPHLPYVAPSPTGSGE